jgi:DNA-binding MarR family transcriptional regulator
VAEDDGEVATTETAPNSGRSAFTLRTDAIAVIERDFGWHGRIAVRMIGRFLDHHLEPAGLSSAQFTLLCLIAAAPNDTMGALAEMAGLDQSTLTRNVEILGKAGWVEIVTAEKDRRRRAVWLTETGAFKLKKAMPLWRKAYDALTEKLDRDALPQLISIARALD